MKPLERKMRGIATLFMLLGTALLVNPRVPVRDSGAKKTAANYEVKIADFSFQPVTLNVPVGATVTWTNKDEEPHTVFSTDNVFKSRALDTDEKFSYAFKKAGTYKYFCSVHPKMVATIEVTAGKKKLAMKMDKMQMK